jgi:Pyruvate/2-oxoacid:ferredoxin oxidoreductase gamma subunit
MSTTEIKFGGFGGQGVILAGIIIGRAASIYNDKFATLTQTRNFYGYVAGSVQQISSGDLR